MRRNICYFLLLIYSTNTFSVNGNLILADYFPDKLSEFEFFIDDSAQKPHENVMPYELSVDLMYAINKNDINESFVALEKTRDTIFSEKLDEHNKSLELANFIKKSEVP